VDPASNVVWEMKLNNGDGIYRASRVDWNPCARPSAKLLKATNITSNSAKISWGPATGASSYNLEYKLQTSSTWTDLTVNNISKKITGLQPSKKYQYRVRSFCSSVGNIYSSWTAIKQFTTAPQKSLLTQEETGLSISLYPNPGKGEIHLDIGLENDETVTLTIFDLTGKKVYATANALGAGMNSLQLNLDHLSPGLYMAEVKTNEEKIIRKLVIE
jgi:hypothetical protein